MPLAPGRDMVVFLLCEQIVYEQIACSRTPVAIDTGGTFTDCVWVEANRLRTLKVFSTPDDPSRAIAQALGKIGVKPEDSASRHDGPDQCPAAKKRSSGSVDHDLWIRGCDRDWTAGASSALRLLF